MSTRLRKGLEYQAAVAASNDKVQIEIRAEWKKEIQKCIEAIKTCKKTCAFEIFGENLKDIFGMYYLEKEYSGFRF